VGSIAGVQDSARDGILCDARRSPHLHRNGVQVAAANGGKAEIRKMRVTRDSGTEVKVDTRDNPVDSQDRYWQR
jgi:hypothetical protein